MKNICNKIKISPFLIILIFISLISGLFRDIISFFIVIIIHEIGHIITSKIFNWQIKRIDITICGGFITYDEVIDKSFKEELLVSISGFLSQLILFVIIFLFYKVGIVDHKIYFLINKYNLSIFLFNFILIYPLDGSKIFYILLNMFLPYKLSLKVLDIISVLSIIFILIAFRLFNIRLEYSYIIILYFILLKIITHIKESPYLYNRLLFERYIYPIKVSKYNYVINNDLKKFKRRKIYYFKIGNHYIKENVILAKKFD